MKTIFRNFISVIKRYKVSSIINILGLSLAFASLYIILTQVYWEFTYNSGIKDNKHVYQIECQDFFGDNSYMALTNRPFIDKIAETSTLVENVGLCFFTGPIKVNYKLDNNDDFFSFDGEFIKISMGILDVLSYNLISGDFKELEQKNTVAISQSYSKKYNLNSGDLIYVGESKLEKKIVAVYKDFPNNCFINENGFIYYLEDENLNNINNYNYNGYIKISPNTSVSDVTKELKDIMVGVLKQNYRERIERGEIQVQEEDLDKFEESNDNLEIRLTPLNKTYFNKNTSYQPGNIGDIEMVITLLAIAILIIIIALVNFLNFFFALVPKRIKSVNTYKIHGCNVRTLRLSLIFESVGIIVISLLISWLIIYIVSINVPANLFKASLKFSDNIVVLIITTITALLVAILSSVYPAYYITSFEPSFVIKGNFGSTKRGRLLRNLLVGFQFAVSIGLLASSLLINKQFKFVQNFDYGFNSENVLSFNPKVKLVTPQDKGGLLETFEDMLRQNPQIIDIAASSRNLVNSGGMSWGRDLDGGESVIYSVIPVSYNFLKFMGINIIEGRDFTINDENSLNGVYIFNKEAKDQFDLRLDTKLSGHSGEYAPIVGFCENFNFKPLQYGVEPLAFYVFGENPWQIPSHIYIRTVSNANVKEVVNHINNCVNTLLQNDENVDVRYFQDELNDNYTSVKKIMLLIHVFTFISILISIMGVFGLVLFESQYRRKEICLRRVNGATVKDILIMFNKKYIIMVLICSAIAIPISYYFVSKWLQNFVYKISISPLIFVSSILIILAITIIIVTISSYKVATENPSATLNKE